MAPNESPRKKRGAGGGEVEYFEPGVQGRKTGITLKENARDEHGIEEIDGLFSSPVKLAQQQEEGGTVGEEDDTVTALDSAEGTSSLRITRNGKTILPPPRARSPLKTYLNSPARRGSSLGPTSPTRQIMDETPSLQPRAEVKRKLDFSKNGSAGASEPAEKRTLGKPFEFTAAQSSTQTRGKRGLVQSSVPEEKGADDSSVEANGDAADASGTPQGDEMDQVAYQDDELPQAAAPQSAELGHDERRFFDIPPSPTQKRGRGRPPKNRPSLASSDVPATSSTAKRGRGRPPKNTIDIRSSSPAQPTAAKRGRGRPPKYANNLASAPRAAVNETTPSASPVVRRAALGGRGAKPSSPLFISPSAADDNDEPTPRPQPRARKRSPSPAPTFSDSSVHPSAAENEPGSHPRLKRFKHTNPLASQASPNTRRRLDDRRHAATDLMEYSDPPPLTSRPGRPHARRPYDRHAPPPLAEREGEVDDDDSDDAYDSTAARMAATPPKRGPGRPRKDGLPPQKRRVVQYVEARVEGGDVVGLFPPPSRPSQQQPQEKKRGPGRPKGSKNKKTLRMSAGGYLPQPQLRLEKWEKETGTLVGPVRSWPDGRGEEEDVELAYAGTSIDLRSVADLSFRYAKILSTPFFGCGLVELPAGAVKRTKNARKMQMCFFVSEGKVLVDVAGSEFRISRGGVWVVPRGNTYSITNDYDLPARIFFAQGCEVEAPPPPPPPLDEEDEEEEEASPEKPAPRLKSLSTKERDRERDREGQRGTHRKQIRNRHEREESTMEQSRRGESAEDSSDEEGGDRRQRLR